jgi:hypothetical protein
LAYTLLFLVHADELALPFHDLQTFRATCNTCHNMVINVLAPVVYCRLCGLPIQILICTRVHTMVKCVDPCLTDTKIVVKVFKTLETFVLYEPVPCYGSCVGRVVSDGRSGPFGRPRSYAIDNCQLLHDALCTAGPTIARSCMPPRTFGMS